MQRTILSITFLFFTALLAAQTATPKKMLELMDTSVTGIKWMGYTHKCDDMEDGGVAIGDVNNDGLEDIYFTGDGNCSLYINKGGFHFEELDHSKGAYVTGPAKSVMIYDVDGDGLKDILVIMAYQDDTTNWCITRTHLNYFDVCESYLREHNSIVFLKNNGNLTFTNQALDAGLLAYGPYLSCTVVDYNNDGLPDILVGAFYHNTNPYALKYFDERYRKFLITNKLFKNLGNGKFENVILKFPRQFIYPGHLNLAIGGFDFDMDGLPDIYINNDWDFPDFYFHNDGNGNFHDVRDSCMGHTSFYAMGLEAADINNDGLPDIYCTDMRPRTNYRQKNNYFEISYDWDFILKNKDYHDQKVENTLQLNRGDGKFSEIGELLGLDATEWSWSNPIMDLDNDGNKDIYVANGNINFFMSQSNFPLVLDSLRHLDPSLNNLYNILDCYQQPGSYFDDYVFHNDGNLKFTDVSKAWGVDTAANTTGAAYGDLDNDGDLDLVVNTNKGIPLIYKNNAQELLHHHYIRLKLVDPNNKSVINSKVWAYCKGQMQYCELQPTRGFESYSEDIIHFGIGANTTVDSILIAWPDQQMQKLTNVKVNQLLTVTKPLKLYRTYKKPINQTLFNKADTLGISYKHQENDYNDFRFDPLLPRMYSKIGPSICVTDLNGDGIDDAIIGGSKGHGETAFIQQSDGKFIKDSTLFAADTIADQATILSFDIDNDSLNDLVIAKGGNEFLDGSEEYKPKVYMNKGKGQFSGPSFLPGAYSKFSSSTCAAATDYNKDGFTDLFIGGRVFGQHYPIIPYSRLLKNDRGTFADVTLTDAPGLNQIGMVSAGIWSDFNNDNNKDLVLVGEFMPITFFKNQGGKFIDYTDSLKFNIKTNGLWNSIIGGNFNNDGRTDYFVGNLGANTRYAGGQTNPLGMYAFDYDGNGSIDVISTYMEDGKTYPTKLIKTLAPRINGLMKKYYQPEAYGSSSIQDVFGEEKVSKAQTLHAYELQSGILWNMGKDSFAFQPLPIEAQFAPQYGVQTYDVNDDGNLDLVMVGNFFSTEVEVGKYDASYGLVLLGDGNKHFKPVPLTESGFEVKGDGKALAYLMDKDKTLFLAGQNEDSLEVFSLQHPTKGKLFNIPRGTSYLTIKLANGKERKEEVYIGSGYLSQTSMQRVYGNNVVSITPHK